MDTTVLAINHIVKTQGVCGGAARIDGTRLTVDWIVGQMVYAGRTLAEMVEDYAHIPLTPAQIHAALAYYYDHQADIDVLIGESEAQLVEIQHPGYVTAREAAELLGLAHESRQVARLSRQGVLRGRKVANRWLISRASIEAYRNTERKPGPRTA
ncbi:MAG: DUF433 domain-containing protein [Anaerolineae bacterium]|nr:DUF433 domain-containing protein [Anaerolineae bacterium]